MRAANAASKEESHNSALEHMAFLEQQRIASEAHYDQRVIAFKERRKMQTLQPRKKLGTQVLPKHRQFK
jgi:hypothetical protein